MYTLTIGKYTLTIGEYNLTIGKYNLTLGTCINFTERITTTVDENVFE
jgi:hypothetical protein